MTTIHLTTEINGITYDVINEHENTIIVMVNGVPTVYSKITGLFITGGSEVKTKNNRRHGGYNR